MSETLKCKLQFRQPFCLKAIKQGLLYKVETFNEDPIHYRVSDLKGVFLCDIDQTEYDHCFLGVDMYFDEENFCFAVGKEHPIIDTVNRPKHYTSHPSGVECIQITEHHNFCIGNAIKHLLHSGLKEDVNKNVKAKQIKELERALWYIDREINRLNGDSND